MVIIIFLLYVVMSAITGRLVYNSLKDEDLGPGYYLAGGIWPITLPIYIVIKIMKKFNL